ncbi:MAG: HAMP domain-containing protein [Oligoflexia bacterium]|nr:HAMP domain-containing protein [Oligoflexia bacterium]
MFKNLKIPIGFKLVSIMAIILVSATLTVVFMATKLFTDDTTAFIQKSNSDAAAQLASQTYEYFNNLVHTFTTITEVQKAEFSEQQFIRHKEIQFVATWTVNAKTTKAFYASNEGMFLKDEFLFLKPSTKVWNGEIDIQRVKIQDKGFITLSFPLVIDSNKKVIKSVIGVINQSKLIQTYGKKGVITSYLVAKDGQVLAHPKEELVATGANLKDVEIVRAMMESTTNNNQMRFIDKDLKSYLGAFRQIGVGGVGVISQVLEETAFATAKRVKYRSSLVAGIILFLSFSFIYFFSQTMTKPIHYLVSLTREVAKGNFKIKVNPKGRDEITELTKSFGEMTTGLAERDKLKETFNKFHSKEIAEAILKGEIKLGGNRQKATVFFSDVRGFTALSEKLTAEQVVEMLNEYMTAMVAEIQGHHGVVDKYVGDAIMAVWGAPISKPQDTWNAVSACLAMRKRLEKFNEERIKKGKDPIRMGMGLHCGELIAGNIGSTEKMEYTVIGDTVNTASRIESMTKEFGTDLLISNEVYQELKERLIVEPIKAHVKGKSGVLNAYKVKGYYDENKNAILVETKYSSYEAEKSDKVKHAS